VLSSIVPGTADRFGELTQNPAPETMKIIIIAGNSPIFAAVTAPSDHGDIAAARMKLL
jgi:hypothetical protein